MNAPDGKFRHESLQDRKTIKLILEAMTKGIGKGELTLSDGDEALTLPIDGLLTLRIKADRSDGASRIDLRVSWNEQVEQVTKKKPPSVK